MTEQLDGGKRAAAVAGRAMKMCWRKGFVDADCALPRMEEH